MISQEEIKKIAIKNQTTELNVLREYFQHLFLRYFYRQKTSEKILFKGGTALRIIYQSPRFSEDLDFSAVHLKKSEIEETIINTLAEAGKEAVTAEIKEAKTTSGGYLAIINFMVDTRPVLIQLEISARKKQPPKDITTIVSDFSPPYILVQLKEENLVEEKIQALLSRQKPRDFYDLYFMLRANMISTDKKQFLAEVLPLLKKSNLAFDKELKIFLPQSYWPTIRNFPQSLEREIERHI